MTETEKGKEERKGQKKKTLALNCNSSSTNCHAHIQIAAIITTMARPLLALATVALLPHFPENRIFLLVGGQGWLYEGVKLFNSQNLIFF